MAWFGHHNDDSTVEIRTAQFHLVLLKATFAVSS